jgi:hypothetical protein
MERLDELATAVLAGLRPQIAATFPFERTADEHRRVEAGSVGGKVVIIVDAPRQTHDMEETST